MRQYDYSGSYRDLLGTAETIIDINDQMHDVEALFAQTSRKSNSRVLDKISSRRRQLQRQHVSNGELICARQRAPSMLRRI